MERWRVRDMVREEAREGERARGRWGVRII